MQDPLHGGTPAEIEETAGGIDRSASPEQHFDRIVRLL
jgi:hypothetical protein